MSSVFAMDGVDALNILSEDKNKIDIIITDINMPRMDGLTLLSKVKEFNSDAILIVVFGIRRHGKHPRRDEQRGF